MTIKRLTDIVISTAAGFVLLPVIMLAALLVRLTSPGPVIHWSRRIGYLSEPFPMAKFRTMVLETPHVPSNELKDPEKWLTPVGAFLRRSSLDEIPQLWCVFRGDMSIVGPRPALFNQAELIALRHDKGVDKLLPGVTGWAQINGRDTINDVDKASLDIEYLERQDWWLDLMIMLRTIPKVLGARGIRH